MASNVVRMSPMAAMPPQPSQQDWVWDGANWVWSGCPPTPCPPFPSPPPCPPAGFPTPCPPWFPPPAAQAPWYPGANAGVSFSATAPVNPIRGNFWWDGTTLHMFDGAAWVTIGPSAGNVMGVTDGSVASPGFVGEVIRQATTGTVSVTNPAAAATNFSALVVPPGDWNIEGTVAINNVTVGCYWDFITFTLLNGAVAIGAYSIQANFTSSAGGIIGGTYSSAVIPLTVAASTTVTCSLQVTGVPGGTAGTGNYTFTAVGRRMR